MRIDNIDMSTVQVNKGWGVVSQGGPVGWGVMSELLWVG